MTNWHRVMARAQHVVMIAILAAALKHQSSKLILRTSTIIFTMTIMVEVLNILQLLHRDSNKAEPVSLRCTNKFPVIEPFSEKYLKKLIGEGHEYDRS
jgi:hypothetical protein